MIDLHRSLSLFNICNVTDCHNLPRIGGKGKLGDALCILCPFWICHQHHIDLAAVFEIVADFGAVDNGVDSKTNVGSSKADISRTYPVGKDADFRIPQIKPRDRSRTGARQNLAYLTEHLLGYAKNFRQFRPGYIDAN